MSDIYSTTTELVPPAHTKDSFLENLEFIDPITHASVWFHRHIVRVIRKLDEVVAWYSNESDAEPDVLASNLLETQDNDLCRRIIAYAEVLKKYHPGTAPKDVLNRDYECVQILLERLRQFNLSVPTLRAAIREVKRFWQPLLSDECREMTRPQYEQFIDHSCVVIVKSFTDICDELATFEEHKRHPEKNSPKFATAEIVKDVVHTEVNQIKENQTRGLKILTKVDQTATTINNRDKRYRCKNKARFTVEQQEGVFQTWSLAKKDPKVKALCENKTGYEAAIIQYRKEFTALGVKSAEDIKIALKARLNRLRR